MKRPYYGMRVFRQIFCLKILIFFMGLLRDIQVGDRKALSVRAADGRAEMAVELELKQLAMR